MLPPLERYTVMLKRQQTQPPFLSIKASWRPCDRWFLALVLKEHRFHNLSGGSDQLHLLVSDLKNIEMDVDSGVCQNCSKFGWQTATAKANEKLKHNEGQLNWRLLTDAPHTCNQ